MAEQDWVRPGAPAEATGAAWPASRQPRTFALRPLSLGEVLDRTFSLYRSRFWLFTAIAMLAASVYTVAQGIALANAEKLVRNPAIAQSGSGPLQIWMSMRHAGAANANSYATMLIFGLVSSVTFAATTLAVTEVYLREQASAGEALRAVGSRWYRWIAIQCWQIGSMLWVPLCALVPALVLVFLGTRSNNVGLIAIGGVLTVLAIVAGFPLGIILYLRNALAIPAAVTEGLTVRAAMRRSKVLAAGAKGRVFMVLFLAGALLEVVGILQLPVSFLILFSPGEEHYLARAISLLVTFVGHTVVAPVAAIGLTLLYYDQRVRKEAFDLQLLLDGVSSREAVPPVDAGDDARFF